MVTVPEIAQALEMSDDYVHHLLDTYAQWVPYGGGGDTPRRYPAWVAAAVADIQRLADEGYPRDEVIQRVGERYGRANLDRSPEPRHIDRVMW